MNSVTFSRTPFRTKYNFETIYCDFCQQGLEHFLMHTIRNHKTLYAFVAHHHPLPHHTALHHHPII